MEQGTIRLLRADEIECRVAAVGKNGVSLLLFKDARVDQKILDEAFTPFGWRRTHQSIDGNLYCTVEVWDSEKSQWIAKQDVGTAGYAEKEKGQASDSFKRACFNWGIGRELYTAPFIWIPAGKAAIQEREGRYTTPDRFGVGRISYNSRREICGLIIVNGRGETVFTQEEKQEERQTGGGAAETAEDTGAAGKGKASRTEDGAVTAGKKITAAQRKALEKELEHTGVSLETVLERYRIPEIGQMTQEIYVKAKNSLKKTKTKEAA